MPVILRYGSDRCGSDAFSKTPRELPTESSLRFAAAREAVYDRMFGEAAAVSHELIPLAPHIDVYSFPPGHKERRCYTLVTSGMSDLRMSVHTSASGAPSRVELIFYCLEPIPEYIGILRRLAHFPHDIKTWMGYGHTMPNGDPPKPFWGSDVLDMLLFMPTIVRPDNSLPRELVLDGDPVHFLWIVPLTTPECNLKLVEGFEAILDLFQRNRHPHIFNPARSSYVVISSATLNTARGKFSSMAIL
jgi:hypothetical protein